MNDSAESGDSPHEAPPCTMVIFGAAGDLTKRLLMPALYNLMRAKLLPDDFSLIGVARGAMSTAQFRATLAEAMHDFIAHRSGSDHGDKLDEAAWSRLSERIEYFAGELTDASTYEHLGHVLKRKCVRQDDAANCLFYLAVGASLFSPIVGRLAQAGLAQETHGWRRIIVEKPFGSDLASAKKLNADLLRVLNEKQIFRIDHYLGKETVQNMMVLRFANGMFEPLWNRDHIDNIQITVAETVGVERRGKFYETTGALRDMVPNHLFQLLSFVAMEPPSNFDADHVRSEKVKVLDAIQRITAPDVASACVRGQYRGGVMGGRRANGYLEESDVSRTSKVETYVALKLLIDNWRWAGVPFYLRTGKSLARRASKVVVQFKRAPFAMFRETSVGEMRSNRLVIHLQPNEGVSLQFGAKIPGPLVRVGGVQMDFNYIDYFDAKPSTGYETLIYDCMLGDATLFQRADSVESAWSVVQPIVDTWSAQPDIPLATYEAGSSGPALADDLLARDGRRWFPLAPVS